MKIVNSLTFTRQNNPEILKEANKVAMLEDRKAHDAVGRILLEALVARRVELEGAE